MRDNDMEVEGYNQLGLSTLIKVAGQPQNSGRSISSKQAKGKAIL